MEDSLIAALLALLLVVTWQRCEEYNSFNSQIADLDILNAQEDLLHFQPSDFNQIDSKLETVNPVIEPAQVTGTSLSPPLTTAPSAPTPP